MIKIISVNAGSSSLKFQLFKMPEEEVLTSGSFERIGFEDAIFTIKVNGNKVEKKLPLENHSSAVEILLKALIEYKVVDDLSEIKGAGHRVVHGGENFSDSAIVDKDVVSKVEELADLAPLHNPAALVGYNAFKRELPNCKHTMVFDTAFHQSIKEDSYLYPLPKSFYRDYKIRKYGFHGTSHRYVANRYAEIIKKDIKDLKIITCHLGAGASICAIDKGKSINTSMGFTPLGGIMMATRCGDIDPAIVPFLMKKTNMTPDEIDTVLNKKSGILGVSEISSDGRDINDAIDSNNDANALLTHDVYTTKAINFIGGYFVQLGGLDAIIFTGGSGENDRRLRAKICMKLKSALKVEIDDEINQSIMSKEAKISTKNSNIDVWVVPTNEELVIARDTYRLLGE